MRVLQATAAAIVDIDANAAAEAQRRLDDKTKPRRSLGRLEELACAVAAITSKPNPPLPRKAIVVMAADHGVASEGVSAYPTEVTWQMLLNFARGGAAINVLARQAGARLVVIDMGVRTPDAGAAGIEVPGVVGRRIGPGTANFTQGPAMSEDQATEAIEHGIATANELAAKGMDLVGIGEMGIGNTTSASALVAALCGCGVEEVVGRGTGIDDAALARKHEVIARALRLHNPSAKAPLRVLADLGGFEIAGLVGVVLGAAARRIPLILDGFIASTAALVACRMQPLAAKYLVASHRSVERGHGLVLEALGVRPLLEFDMRLGEGTGAALAMPIVESAIRILRDMASFSSAGVTDTGR
jgi:nicotinate-nucleotide--dimethylbenzimidazole phosphoribosyltransferase